MSILIHTRPETRILTSARLGPRDQGYEGNWDGYSMCEERRGLSWIWRPISRLLRPPKSIPEYLRQRMN